MRTHLFSVPFKLGFLVALISLQDEIKSPSSHEIRKLELSPKIRLFRRWFDAALPLGERHILHLLISCDAKKIKSRRSGLGQPHREESKIAPVCAPLSFVKAEDLWETRERLVKSRILFKTFPSGILSTTSLSAYVVIMLLKSQRTIFRSFL